MKIKKLVMLCAIMLLANTFSVQAEMKDNGEFKYAVENYSEEKFGIELGICIYHYVATESNAILEFPDEIDGYRVMEISNGTVTNSNFFVDEEIMQSIKEVVFPQYVEKIWRIFRKANTIDKITNNSNTDFDLTSIGLKPTEWYMDQAGKEIAKTIPKGKTIYKINNKTTASSSNAKNDYYEEPIYETVYYSDSYLKKKNATQNLLTIGPYVYDGKWEEKEGKWLFIKNNGEKVSAQWVFWNNCWYLFGKDAYMLTGWQLVNGKWYYLDFTGEMLTGWRNVNEKWYFMDESGAMYSNTVTPDGYLVNENGEWVQ